MRILLAAAEALPWYKTGGLADVARALPDALVARGHDVRIIMPGYRFLRARMNGAVADAELSVEWPTGPRRVSIALHEEKGSAATAFVLTAGAFDTERPYDDLSGDALALGRRYALFSRAVVQYANHWNADVVHLNDWQTGLVPLYGVIDGLRAATLFSIHNLAYQGNFNPYLLHEIGVPAEFFRTENGVEFHGMVSFMKTGIALADRLATVSPTYAQEIRTAQHGVGLQGLLEHRRRLLHGVVNGIDTTAWNPATDAYLPQPFTPKTLATKDVTRAELLRAAGITGAGAVLGIVSRLAQQKGLELVLAAVRPLMERGCSIVVLGSGEAHLEHGFETLAREYPARVAIYRGFNEPLAHLIYGGADFFLMPSLYEPCGLGQMIAQRYGTPPIARRTGGLADTIVDGQTGFLFDAPHPAALVEAVDRALAIWCRRGWRSLQQRCMREDHSWTRSAAEYERVYRLALGALAPE